MNMTGEIKKAGLRLVHNEKGFTLLELLLAVSIMSALFVGLYATFFSVTRSRTSIMETLESTRQIRRFMDVMATEVRSSFYKATSERTLFEGEFSEQRGRALSKVSFTWFSYPLAGTRTGANKGRASELMAVSYFLDGLTFEEDIENNAWRAGGATLYKIRWNPYEGRESGYTAEVMENVESFLLSYFTGEEWVKNWDASREKKLPKAIKIELALREGEDRIKRYSSIMRTALGKL